MNPITGMCLCERVSYEISGELGPIFNCHCSKCRRWHGAAFRTRASIDISQFNIVTGRDNLTEYASSDNVSKYFCKNCGSPLHSTYKDRPNIIGIPLGALEGVGDSVPLANIFTDSKATWYEITDELPRYPSWPGSESKVRETNS
ncbi:MAG: GFA family protein [Kangiellaceae bacterium]|nr:GFA family protein [Kangiellaceae bacterium]